MVPADAPDIRDSGGESFSEAETYAFRAGAFDIAGMTLIALGSLMSIFALVGLFRGARRRRAADEGRVSDAAIVRAAFKELTAVQEEAGASGWTERHVERALGATRIVAAEALGRKASQARVNGDATGNDGRLIAAGTWRQERAAVSSSATAEAVAERLNALPEPVEASKRQLLTDLHAALASFTAVQYSRDSNVHDRSSLDAALSGAIDAARRLHQGYAWPRPQVWRWLGRSREADRRA